MIANLMMYARPELADAHTNYWNHIRRHLAAAGIDSPASLSQDAEEFSVWRDPQLVLSQTCGMPYRKFLHGGVQLVGTPDYALDGCEPGYYRSAIIARCSDSRRDVTAFENATFGYNQTISQSGYAAIYTHTAALGFWFRNRHQTHSHLNSARAVADRQIDIAAVDAVTWRLIKQYEPFAKGLQVLDWTEPTPGLPYITSTGMNADAIFKAVDGAINELSAIDRKILGIAGLYKIPADKYLALENPPED